MVNVCVSYVFVHQGVSFLSLEWWQTIVKDRIVKYVNGKLEKYSGASESNLGLEVVTNIILVHCIHYLQHYYQWSCNQSRMRTMLEPIRRQTIHRALPLVNRKNTGRQRLKIVARYMHSHYLGVSKMENSRQWITNHQ